jgi:hypothetical protein
MSNPAFRYEVSILFTWREQGEVRAIQLLRDGSLAVVDESLNVIRAITREDAVALRARVGEDPDGYLGTPSSARFSLALHNPLEAR